MSNEREERLAHIRDRAKRTSSHYAGFVSVTDYAADTEWLLAEIERLEKASLALANHVDGKVPIKYWNDYAHLLDDVYRACGIESNRAGSEDS